MNTLDSITEQLYHLHMDTTEGVKGNSGMNQKKDTKDANDKDTLDEESDREKNHYIKYMNDSIADSDDDITLNTILNYPPEKRKLWEDQIRREIMSLIKTS
jgi:hypothetical protein